MPDYMTCPDCGAKYTYTEFSTAMRDKDSYTCDTPGCNGVVHSWNGAVIFSLKLAVPAPSPLNGTATDFFWTFFGGACVKCKQPFQKDQTQLWAQGGRIVAVCAHCHQPNRFGISIS